MLPLHPSGSLAEHRPEATQKHWKVYGCTACDTYRETQHASSGEGCVLTHSPRLQIHFAEEWNELHHLQIMESLGGDQYWIDRFAAQHAAVFYYWVLVFFFAFSPELAYVFSELVEVGRPHICMPPMHPQCWHTLLHSCMQGLQPDPALKIDRSCCLSCASRYLHAFHSVDLDNQVGLLGMGASACMCEHQHDPHAQQR